VHQKDKLLRDTKYNSTHVYSSSFKKILIKDLFVNTTMTPVRLYTYV